MRELVCGCGCCGRPSRRDREGRAVHRRLARERAENGAGGMDVGDRRESDDDRWGSPRPGRRRVPVVIDSVSKNVLARVLVRVMISAPRDVARADIAKGTMLAKPSMLNQSAVSKAVACLVEHGLVTQYSSRSDPEERAGRPVIPLSLGSSTWALMGIKWMGAVDAPVGPVPHRVSSSSRTSPSRRGWTDCRQHRRDRPGRP
jgi:hypothetical protein